MLFVVLYHLFDALLRPRFFGLSVELNLVSDFPHVVQARFDG